MSIYTLIKQHPDHTIEVLDLALPTREAAIEKGRRLSEADLDQARYEAVMALAGIRPSTLASELTPADLDHLARECVALPYLGCVPGWAIDAIKSVSTDRRFHQSRIRHILAAIRCAKDVNRKYAGLVATYGPRHRRAA